ncbi:MAG: phosphatidate cytidylyltransferase [Solirubrobacterales bacterium]|nr:phosphatidate cytidylyltransferase [Solirubrobacterales bacterium]MCB8970176.1 phosphatidate cytidylyltransferase [Thermoleophilales bacterium]MCO5326728.1 phosphatidate cytidylyltransferase [Solirubrobacterales bacterium]
MERRRPPEPDPADDPEAGTGSFDWTSELSLEQPRSHPSMGEAEPYPARAEDAPRGRRGGGSRRRGGRAGSADGEERRRPQRRISSETVSRILWAVPWVVFAIFVIAAGDAVFAVAMIAVGWALLVEYFRMTARARPFQLVGFAAAAAMVAAAYLGDSFQILLVAVAFFPVMLAFAIARPTLHNVTWAMAVTVFGVVWIGVPLAHAVLLRDIPEHGGALLVDVLVCTFFTDTFAYVGGRMFGQHPLAPTVSPNKTIEGLVIGIAGGVFGFWLAGLYQDWLSGADALLMGLCIAILAPMGDLFESAIKRDLDVKDTGRMLGPHGGLLDRLDAVLFTVVAGYYLALAIVV